MSNDNTSTDSNSLDPLDPLELDTIVFSGGGSKGYCYIGVIKHLDEVGILPNLKTYMGTSIGSLFATLLCIGYTYKELYDVFIHFDYSDFHRINIMNFLCNYGLDDFSGMEGLIIKLFTVKSVSVICTFADLYKQTGKRLCINAISLNSKKVVYFNHETSPDMKVIIALKSSMAIPYIFVPVKYNDDMYIDGGLLENFMINHEWLGGQLGGQLSPITPSPEEVTKENKEHSTSNIKSKGVLGINLFSCSNTSEHENAPIDIYQFSQAVISCIFDDMHRREQSNSNKKQKIITINCDNNSLDFDLDMENKQSLFKLGYETMLNSFKVS